MGLPQEASEGASQGTFLEDACPRTLVRGAPNQDIIEWSKEHKKTCGVGSWICPPQMLSHPPYQRQQVVTLRVFSRGVNWHPKSQVTLASEWRGRTTDPAT